MFELFGNMIDFNGDGKMDCFERVAEYAFFEEMVNEEITDEYEETKLEMSGLDIDELEFMDPDERRELLEEAGLDSDEYDF